jgi:hypothetical protein
MREREMGWPRMDQMDVDLSHPSIVVNTFFGFTYLCSWEPSVICVFRILIWLELTHHRHVATGRTARL